LQTACLTETTHQHITHLWWTSQVINETGACTRATIVKWIENEGGEAYVDEGLHNRHPVIIGLPVGAVSSQKDPDR
jgi:hypothetical protein